MSKSLYSLILMDDVVAEIDRLALRQNTSRSNLVNQILAEYASLLTPEKRIGGIYKRIEEIMSQSNDLIPLEIRCGTFSLKSSLDYKYRPTIRYEVQLYREPEEYIGELNVILRTQSEQLLQALTAFFRFWKHLEDTYVADQVGPIRYKLIDGRFIRSISVPRTRDYSGDEVGEAISAYIAMLDDLMKQFVSQRRTPEQIESSYQEYLRRGVGLI